MAIAKYIHLDGRKSSCYCLMIAMVVFVSFGLIEVLNFKSSSLFLVQNSNFSSTGTEDEKKHVDAAIHSGPSENYLSDLPKDATERVVDPSNYQNGNHSQVKDPRDSSSKRLGNEKEKNQDEKPVKGNPKMNTKSKDDPGMPSENNGQKVEDVGKVGDVKAEGGEVVGSNGTKSEGTSGESEGNVRAHQMLHKNRFSSQEEKEADQIQEQPENHTQNGALANKHRESQSEKENWELLQSESKKAYNWKVCNTTAGPDYIPCLDDWQTIRRLRSIRHYQHRERHCPDQAPTCLVPLPDGYKLPIKWPISRDKIWYSNVPHAKLVEIKGHQNWVKLTGEYFTFPGGGTQFKHGAINYIDSIEKSFRKIEWGTRSRVVLDVGCGVASFGGYLVEKDVLTMSFAPKDNHKAQVQFALERGIPAILGVMGTKRLPFPSSVFDLVHCARCRVPWHIDGGRLLLELNRVLRPGGYFVWSATPVYEKLPEDIDIWRAMTDLTKSMCWDLVVIQKDMVNGKSAAIYRKPTSNECYDSRPQNEPPLCTESDDPDASWNVTLGTCIHKVPTNASERGFRWPEQWPLRLEKPPYWLKSKVGVYGKAAPEDFMADYSHWKQIVSHSYLTGVGIKWSSVRNIMDMRAVYGGFAAALKGLKVWVMNVVPVGSPDTLPVIYERGLFGIYHDWCESFNTYPRSYDLLHANHLFSGLKMRCNLKAVIAEVDRILRPEGKLLVRDNFETVSEVEKMVISLEWQIRFMDSQDNEGVLCVQKSFWRPKEKETVISAIDARH